MCRRQTLTTLSPAERSVAEQHYRLVEWYVRHRGLPVDEYLDVAVFGYLLAVKRWFARPDLYRYEFTTIACAAMRSAIGNEQRKQSRRIKTVSLDDPIPGTDGMTWKTSSPRTILCTRHRRNKRENNLQSASASPVEE